MPDDHTKSFALSAATRDAVQKNAQAHFTASQRRDLEARKEIASQQEVSAAKIAKLRALRLAKEESDRLVSDNAVPAGKKIRKKKTADSTNVPGV